MPGVVTEHFRLNNAEHFLNALSESNVLLNRYYIFIGHPQPFSVDNNPPSPNNSYASSEYDPWRDMVAMKRVQASDASYITRRINWSNNTFYTQYSDRTANLANTNYYVLQTDDYYVYKCIDNNRGANSTVKPTGKGSGANYFIGPLADGYRWKYMFAISEADRNKFMTLDWMPVKQIDSDDSSEQWAIQQAAANGAIHHIQVTANGSGYTYNTGNVVSVNSTGLIVSSTASANDSYYNEMAVFISAGLGSGQVRRITAYNGVNKFATVNTAFTTTPNTQSQYIISPRVVIKGDSGQTAASRATAYVSNTAGGQIRKITMISEGLNYSRANAMIIGAHGTGATVLPIISPPAGHGSDPSHELFAYNVVLNTQFIGAEGNTLFTNNDFRAVGLVVDPHLRSGPRANASLIDQCTRLTLSNVSGDFTADELITGDTNGATAIVTRFSNTNASGTKGILRVIDVKSVGTGKFFDVGGTVTGANSGVTGVISAVARPAVREYTGRILYYEYRQPIDRAADQTENIKFIAKF